MFTRLTGAASLAAAIALPLVLSACSSSDSGTSMAQPELLPLSASSLQEAVAGKSMAMAAAAAAMSPPRRGSVTQSANAADLVNVTFNRDDNSFTIRNTAAEAGWTIGTGNIESLNAADGGVGLVQRVEGGQRVVVVYPRTAEEGETDWLAAGIWAFVPDSSEALDDYEFGAFADGNDPFDLANLQALTGTAEYVGQAVGVYYSLSTDGSEAGPFTADVALVADFDAANTTHGSISGTVRNVETEGGSPIGATLALEPAAIGSSEGGFFTGSTSMTFDGRDYAGDWGGQFFGDGAAPTDAPASVAGTFGATTSENGGTGSLVGAFGAERTGAQ